MPSLRTPGGAAAMLAAALLSLGGRAAAAQTAAPPAAAPPRPAAALAESDRAAVERARADSARLPYTAADVRFMSMMIGHHAQAVEMARLAPDRAGSAAVRTLAARIINAQRDEIAIMQQWLRDRRKPVPVPAALATHHGAGHHGAGHHEAGHHEAAHDSAGRHAAGHAGTDHAAMGHASTGHAGTPDHASMPGMLTPAQMKELGSARGREFDRLFLTYMIQHHRGAVAMVKELFGTYGAGQDEIVFRFATDVNVDQTTEIARMQRMLADVLFGAP